MADKPMRDHELSRRLFSDECDDALAPLARRALERLAPEAPEGDAPAWLDAVSAAPPEIPAPLLASTLKGLEVARKSDALRRSFPARLIWLWGGGMAVAAVLGLLMMRSLVTPPSPQSPAMTAQGVPAGTMPPPAQIAQALEAEAPALPPPAARPDVPSRPAAKIAAAPKTTTPSAPPATVGRTVPTGDWAIMPARPVLATVEVTPRLHKALLAYLADDSTATRDELLAALTASGLDLASTPKITRIRVADALEARAGQSPPERLRAVLDGRGGLSLAE